MLKTIKIYKEEICNLSRIPINVCDNPCYKTTRQIIDAVYADTTLSYKEAELYNHYQIYNPKTIFDLYGVVDKLSSQPLGRSFLPWIYKEPLKNQVDVAFIKPLSSSHTSSENFIHNQVKKLEFLVESFRKFGYSPSSFPDRKGGHITGYFLKKGDTKRFYVVSGNHRTSVFCAFFPEKAIPVVYESSKFAKSRELQGRQASEFLQIYDLNDVSDWPSVKSEFLTADEALKIAEVYINV